MKKRLNDLKSIDEFIYRTRFAEPFPFENVSYYSSSSTYIEINDYEDGIFNCYILPFEELYLRNSTWS